MEGANILISNITSLENVWRGGKSMLKGLALISRKLMQGVRDLGTIV
jgi:hypothetical protein